MFAASDEKRALPAGLRLLFGLVLSYALDDLQAFLIGHLRPLGNFLIGHAAAGTNAVFHNANIDTGRLHCACHMLITY